MANSSHENLEKRCRHYHTSQIAVLVFAKVYSPSLVHTCIQDIKRYERLSLVGPFEKKRNKQFFLLPTELTPVLQKAQALVVLVGTDPISGRVFQCPIRPHMLIISFHLRKQQLHLVTFILMYYYLKCQK